MSEYIGYGKSSARKALQRQVEPNWYNMRIVPTPKGQEPDYILERGSERVALTIA